MKVLLLVQDDLIINMNTCQEKNTLIGILFIIGTIENSKKKVELQVFLYKCWEIYSNDMDICVKMAFGQGHNLDEIEPILKQYIAEHSKGTKKGG